MHRKNKGLGYILSMLMLALVMVLTAANVESMADVTWDHVRGEPVISVDTSVKYTGADYSIKVDNITYGCSYVSKIFDVKPNTLYKVSVMAKYSGYELHPNAIYDSGAVLCGIDIAVGSPGYRGSEWKELTLMFDSGEKTNCEIGLWNGHYGEDCKGTAWFSDFKLEEYAKDVVDEEGVSTYYFEAESQIHTNITEFMDDNYSNAPYLFEFWGEDGLYRIVYSDSENIYIDLLDNALKRTDTIKIAKAYDKLGNIIQDKNGNYFIVYGQDDFEQKGNVPVMAVCKYSAKGKLLGEATYTGYEIEGSKKLDFSTMEPFSAGNCDVAIDNDGILIARYGRKMYNTHQSSHTLYVDTKTMEKKDYYSPYNSHSFNQKLMIASDGSYIMAERGDAFDRGIILSRVYNDLKGNKVIDHFIPFHLRTGLFYQKTYATISGIAEMSNGYALVGTSVKTLSCKVPDETEDLEARNLFMQVYRRDFNSKDTSSASAQVLKGSTRVATDIGEESNHSLDPNAKDYGVVWLTNYTGLEYASVPKTIQLDSKRLLLLWEKKQHRADETTCYFDDYLETFYCIVSMEGEFILKPTSLGKHRLAQFGQPTYKDGYVYITTVADLSAIETDKKYYAVNKIKVKDVPIKQPKIAAVKNLSYSENNLGQPMLEWTDANHADEYVIYRKLTKSGKYKKIGTTTYNYFVDTSNLTQGKTYYYKVRSVYKNAGKYKESKAVKLFIKEIKWDNTKSYTSKVNVSVDRKVKYGDSGYSIKIVNDGYDCGFAEKTFEVKPKTRYRVSVMVKYTGYELHPDKYYDSGASLGIGDSPKTYSYKGSTWKKMEFEFTTAKNQNTCSISLWNGMFGADCKGTAYFSSFKLVECK